MVLANPMCKVGRVRCYVVTPTLKWYRKYSVV